MSGILDSKSRIIDAILTIDGRRQMAEGTFDISYVTFSDLGVSYDPDVSSGHVDPTNRIYLEACNLPQDQITFEANDQGKIVPFRSQDIKVSSPEDSINAGFSEAYIVDGKLVVNEYHYGRRIKVNAVSGDKSDHLKGFVYSDSLGITASILLDPYRSSETISVSGPPYTGLIGTSGGMSANQFSLAISGAIDQIKLAGGPNVSCASKSSTVFLDVGQDATDTKIFRTGSVPSIDIVEPSATGGRIVSTQLENASFASQIKGILTSSFDNFDQLYTLSSINRVFEDDLFVLSTNEMTFDLSKISSKMLNVFKESPPTLNSIDSIFSDDKMSHLENFMYLPPIVKTSDSIVTDKTNIENLKPYLLGDYPSWGDNEKNLTFLKLTNQLRDYEDPMLSVYFNKSSRNNNIIGQFFEVTPTSVNKLDVVEFGEVMNDAQEPTLVTDKVFFAGKTFIDNRGTTCFVNMFTLVFSKDSRQERQVV